MGTCGSVVSCAASTSMLLEPRVSISTEQHCCLQDHEVASYAPTVDTATKPYANLDIFVANEAYSTQQVGPAPAFSPCWLH